MQLSANPAALLTSQENVAFEHTVANVLEPNRRFPDFAPQPLCNLVDHFCGGKRFRHIPAHLARTRQMPQQNRKDLMRCDKRSIAIHCADAIAVSVERESRIVVAATQSLP